MKKGILALLSLMGWMYPTLAHAQFIGYTSPQTVQQTLANNLACTGSTQILPIENLGQTEHFLTIAGLTASMQSLTAQLQGVDVAGNAVPISDTLVLGGVVSSGSLFASGYYPKVQVSVICTATATFSANYSGVTATSPYTAGSFLLGQIDKVLLSAASGASNQVATFQTPFGSAGGTLFFQYSSGHVAGSTVALNCASAGGLGLAVLSPTAVADSGNVQMFTIPDVPCPNATFEYVSGGAAGNIVAEYIFAVPGRVISNSATAIGSVTQGTSPWVVSGTVNAAQSGTWTVQPGNTANTTPWLATQNPVTTAGNALSNSAQATLTTSVNVKASAGNLYGVFALNGAASTCWVQFIDNAGAGTLGTGVVYSVPLPASTTQPVYIQPGPFALSHFASGIAVGIATTATGATPCGTGGNVVVEYF